MKIVHVLNTLCVGGRERIVIDICNNIDAEKHEVFVVTLSNDNNELLSQLKKNVKVISLPYRDAKFLDKCKLWLFGMLQMKKILKEINPDIIHSHLHVQYFLFLSLILRFSKLQLKFFRTVHTSGLFYGYKSVVDKLKVNTEKLATRIYSPYIVSVSKTIQEKNRFFFSKYAKDIRLIPNGIDLGKFSREKYSDLQKEDFGLSNDRLLVTYVARLDNGKNHSCLLKAWTEVVKVNENLCLLLVGDGILKDILEKQAKELGIEDYVVFYGSSNQVPEILSISDMAVFPSQFEGFPVSLLEKMTMELSIVASNIDVFKEVIRDGHNGVLYDVNDAQQLAEAILNLLKNPDKRFKIGKQAKEHSKQYDINIIANNILEYYATAV